MVNFRELSEKEEYSIWLDLPVDFRGPLNSKGIREVKSHLPYIKIDISNYYKTSDPINYTKTIEKFALNVFQKITSEDERMYALDWQHQCYSFDPRLSMERNEFGDWIVPVIPNGDYYIFLTKDFKNVWFGHPWEESITFFGQKIIDTVKFYSSELNSINILI